jgi:hypothetical protein
VADGQPGAESRAIGGDQTTPDTMFANAPVPQRQLQALAAYQAARADSDRGGRLLTGPARVNADREPLVGIQTAVSTPGVHGDPGRQRLLGQPASGAIRSGEISAAGRRLVTSSDVTASETACADVPVRAMVSGEAMDCSPHTGQDRGLAAI